ncbi:MAG TPA: hypothetical protein VK957_05260 [Lunatimonas sp.]|nr:hypothetical protein [Lunatimonas sp.]
MVVVKSIVISKFSLRQAFILICLWVACTSCEHTLLEEVLVYQNDFSAMDVTNIENAMLDEFQGRPVLGPYNAAEVTIAVPNLPSHNTVRVSVDILMHDSWDGNSDDVGGPDFWYMQLDGSEVIRTTFSNSPCNSLYCLYQSYPENYPRFLEPKTGAETTQLPGRCQYAGIPGWTTLYRITKLISHSKGQLNILLGDELKQTNTSNPICDESWSIANIEVSTLTIK